ncbi:MAG: photosynthetic reaction center cytochrome c subunit [Proteobacteria bacterium]|nr:MAG: photosynthetic reaction center cytochrome c subunit [Pseudomonadota bacterium]
MQNNAVYYKSLVVFGAGLFVCLLILSPRAYTESAAKMKTNEERVREEMIVISRQLGVTCAECHNVQNFANGDKKTFKVSKDHMRIVETLRGNGFDGKKGPEASCFMCHQGKLRPDYKEKESAKN